MAAKDSNTDSLNSEYDVVNTTVVSLTHYDYNTCGTGALPRVNNNNICL